jgi:hypothetical protein
VKKLDNGNAHSLLVVETNRAIEKGEQLLFKYSPKDSYFQKDEQPSQPVLQEDGDVGSSGTDSDHDQDSDHDSDGSGSAEASDSDGVPATPKGISFTIAFNSCFCMH